MHQTNKVCIKVKVSLFGVLSSYCTFLGPGVLRGVYVGNRGNIVQTYNVARCRCYFLYLKLSRQFIVKSVNSALEILWLSHSRVARQEFGTIVALDISVILVLYQHKAYPRNSVSIRWCILLFFIFVVSFVCLKFLFNMYYLICWPHQSSVGHILAHNGAYHILASLLQTLSLVVFLVSVYYAERRCVIFVTRIPYLCSR